MTTATVTHQSRQRVDASRNRERIIEAAREAFIENGPDVPLDAIAHRAGVGNATLYRHFADRRELVLQVTLSSFDRITEAAEAALADDTDAFEALRGFVHRAARERVGSLCSLLSPTLHKGSDDITAARLQLDETINRLMDRARRSGQLRADVALGDLMIAITQLTRPLPGRMCGDFDRFMHRHLELFIDGLHNPARSTLPGSAVTFEDLERDDS